jgi:hypothetical protein
MNAVVSPREANTVSSNSGEIFAGRLAPTASAEQAAAPSKPTAAVVAGRATVAGSVPADVVERAVGERQRDLEACYADARRARPGLSGQLMLQFVISNEGTLKELQTLSADQLPFTLVDCALIALRKVQLQTKGDGVAPVLYTLKFSLETLQ